jgi:AbrB family looped-hinge helix DNA binding protein
MSAVTISPKYQVVIPKEIRESMRIRPGQKMEVLHFRDRIELVPLKPLSELMGFLKGIDTEIHKDKDRV